MVLGLFRGLTYVFRGLSLITQKGIRPFVILPLLINITVFSVAIWFTSKQLDSWINQLLPDWLLWLQWLLWPVLAVAFFFVIFYLFTILANIIAAPFNSILAERVENRLEGLPVPEFQGYKSLPALIAKTFKSEAKKLFYMAKWFVALFILTIIPGLNIVAPFAWLIFGSWMLSIEYIDYPMGNHNLFFKDELTLLKNNKALALGFGGGLTLLTSTPFINFLAMPIGVAGSTALWVEHLKRT